MLLLPLLRQGLSGHFDHNPGYPGWNSHIKSTDSSGSVLTAVISTSNSMTISPDSGPVGTTISIAGKGFTASSVVVITYNGVNMVTSPAPLMTDSNGNFTVPLKSSHSIRIIYDQGQRWN